MSTTRHVHWYTGTLLNARQGLKSSTCSCHNAVKIKFRVILSLLLHFLFLLKDNCFTKFCCFLSNINMHQPQGYTCPLPPRPPSRLPAISALQADTGPLSECPESEQIPIATCFTFGTGTFHVTLSSHPLLPTPTPLTFRVILI